MVEFRVIPPILVISTKKMPETAFWCKSAPKRTFWCPGPLKKHRKSIGFVGVSAPGPPKHHFHPTGLKMVYNHLISMKCCEIPSISTKMGEFGRIPPQGGDTLPKPVLNVTLLQPSEKPTRACDCNIFLLIHVKT